MSVARDMRTPGPSADIPVHVPVDGLLPADSPRSHTVNMEHARALAESEAPLPPIVVHRTTNRVVDGMHRLQATKLNGAADIEVVYFDGDAEDAFILAVESNVRHGLPLSLEERSAAAERIVRARPELADRAVALSAGVSAKTVSAIRSRISHHVPVPDRRVGRDGRVRPLDSSDGRRNAAELLAGTPGMSLRQIAKESGVSPTTVRDVRERLDRGADPVPSAIKAASKPRTDPAARDATEGAATDDVVHTVCRLRADPALRFNERGRMLLRLLDPGFVDPRGRDALLAATPPYWAPELAHVARAYSAAWQAFSAALDEFVEVS